MLNVKISNVLTKYINMLMRGFEVECLENLIFINNLPLVTYDF